MRVLKFLLGIFLILCSTGTAVYFFVPHSTANLRAIFEYGHYELLLWSIAPGGSFAGAFVLGVWLALSACSKRRDGTALHEST